MDCDYKTCEPGECLDQDLICIPLYILSKEYVRIYKECLKKINLTFTQFIVMIVMWYRKEMKVKEIGRCLFLDSGTLTPVLKKLETKGFVLRTRSEDDARDLNISLTESGERLMDDARIVRENMKKELGMSQDKAERIDALLRELIYLLSGEFEEKTGRKVQDTFMDFVKTEDRI